MTEIEPAGGYGRTSAVTLLLFWWVPALLLDLAVTRGGSPNAVVNLKLGYLVLFAYFFFTEASYFQYMDKLDAAYRERPFIPLNDSSEEAVALRFYFSQMDMVERLELQVTHQSIGMSGDSKFFIQMYRFTGFDWLCVLAILFGGILVYVDLLELRFQRGERRP